MKIFLANTNILLKRTLKNIPLLNNYFTIKGEVYEKEKFSNSGIGCNS